MGGLNITPMIGMGFSFMLLIIDVILRIAILYLSILAIRALKSYLRNRS